MDTLNATSRSHAAGGSITSADVLVDPSSVLTIALDASYRALTPAHWAYELLNAVKMGDLLLVRSTMAQPCRRFTIDLLSEPLGPLRQTLLHVAALTNQGAILCEFLAFADAHARAACEEEKLRVRKESLAARGSEPDPVVYQTRLGKSMDKIERRWHVKCEEQFLALMNTKDAADRTVLHYCAASRGTSTMDALHYEQHHFLTARSSDMAPGAPFILFPADGWVCRSTGCLWQPEYYEFPQDHPPQAAPEGYIAVLELLRARKHAAFSDPRDVHGASPLHYATCAGDVRSVRALLELGADAFACTALGASPLDLATSRVMRTALMPMENAVQISCGLKMQRAGIAGTSPKRSSSSSSSSSPTLRGGSASPGGGSAWGAEEEESPTATRKRVADKAVLQLLSAGEDINMRTGIKMQAPLHMAAEKAAEDVVALLLQNGAVVDICDVDGRTPLHYAAELGTRAHMRVVKMLYDNGANIDATSSLRKTPLHLAATGGPDFEAGCKLYSVAPWERQEEEGEGGEAAGSSSSSSGSAGFENSPPGSPYAGIGLGSATARSLRGGGGGEASPAAEEAAAAAAAAAKARARARAPGGTADGNTAMIALLHSLGANLEAYDLEENTPLLAAAGRGNHLAVQKLLLLGARVYAVNVRGHSALHCAAAAAQHACVRTLTRWDAEVGKLKFLLDTSGRSAYDVAADGATRAALHTLVEAAASGRLDLVQGTLRATALLPPSATNPWLPMRIWEASRVLGRTPLHALCSGAARAMAGLRKDMEQCQLRGGGARGAAALAAASTTHVGTAAALALALAQRRGREEGVPPPQGTGFSRHKLSPSAVQLVAGIGLRFVLEHARDEAAGGALVAEAYRGWGDWGDVLLTFPTVRNPELRVLSVDVCAYVPPRGAHLAFMPSAAVAGDVGRSAAAAERVKTGSELTSCTLEKEYGRCADFLIKAGVDVNAGDGDGVSALSLAARYGLLYVMRKLLARGADAGAVDAGGNTALHWAKAFAQGAAADVLVEGAGGAALEERVNAAGARARDVWGRGLLILPASRERDLRVGKVPKKSASLQVSVAL